MALCFKCGKEERYQCNLNGKMHSNPWCKTCIAAATRARYHAKPYDAEGRHAQNRKHDHGITRDEFNLMLFQQAGVCAICGGPEVAINPATGKPRALAVDHNHQTGDIRELLCNACNHAVGYLEKDRGRYRKALNYLKKHDR